MINGIREMDVARWALQVNYPEYVDVEAEQSDLDDNVNAFG